ncbi:MAG: terpene cyclase/mutase family protein [Planctomycetes bacterium]|nr:terpene cyclase/mutase family protein [Planctomycetota bacterium]
MSKCKLEIGFVIILALADPACADVKMDEGTQTACERALRWLASKQNSDGSWSDGGYVHNTAITSFALLSFMAQGHLPNQGLYGPEVAKGARFLMASARPQDGYLVGARGGNMYCHAMATLALGELYGSTGDDAIRPVLKKAVDLIVRCQNSQGGWRYNPVPADADISVTIMTVMALRSAKNGGLHVPDNTLKKAVDYIESCYNPKVGAFSYQRGGYNPGFARSAAGTCVLFLTGRYKAEQIPKAVEYLKKNFKSQEHFYYGHYYAAHAMHQVGGKAWEDWYARLVQHFLPQQAADGSWSRSAGRSPGPVYQTSIAVIILSVPAHYLPIFQR